MKCFKLLSLKALSEVAMYITPSLYRFSAKQRKQIKAQ
ncbi:MAG: hypothetical protein ACJAXH_001635 [Colwellia sp.]|jgi:hypothetical protein